MPAEWLEGSPRLVILQGWALLLAGHLDELESCLALFPRSLPQPTARRQRELLAQGQLLATLLAHARGRGAQALGEAAAQLPDWAWAQTGLAWLTLADAALAQGRIADAQALNRRATGLARRHDCQALEGLLLLQHAEMLEMRGELGRADTLLQRLLQALPRDASADLLRGRARLRRARLLAHLGQREEAASLYRQGLRECTECADPWLAQGYLGLAELDAEAGDFPAAFSRLAELERELQQRRVDESCYRAKVGLLRGRLWLCQGQHARALHLAGQCLEQDASGACPELSQRLWLLRARALSAAGQDLEAELEQRLHQALNEGRHGMGRELLFALAESHFARGRQRKAQGALLDGLALGRRMGMAGMEWHCRPSDPGLAGWAGKASVPCADSPSAALAQLSRRELSVLQMIARGLRNQDIAEHLHLSLHTVKSHAQRINVKLGVSSRVQAVVRAKELSLIG
ncbi:MULTISPECIES: LuxR C-terminal-related transcriptional regulator [unclassified Pseudomonas]|uniref:helix-turn-helix transcriptional regulator n=1 Tax=unclassified Pseudomonas TaxID=196821 RepID=UPI00244B76D5|nr:MULTISPECIES: LuxR C-terminal-related transcriptional regulator [unclassified Pseudomonas]